MGKLTIRTAIFRLGHAKSILRIWRRYNSTSRPVRAPRGGVERAWTKSYVYAGRYIRLTSDRQAQSGWLFSRMPMTATNWMIEVEFKIHGAGHLHGDGMAIWLTEERAQPGKVFGHRDNFNGLGVFIDTYKNQRPGVVFPYVMAMLGNSSVSYDKDHDGKDNELAGCSVCSLTHHGISMILINTLGARSPNRRYHSHQNPTYLLPRYVSKGRPPTQSP